MKPEQGSSSGSRMVPAPPGTPDAPNEGRCRILPRSRTKLPVMKKGTRRLLWFCSPRPCPAEVLGSQETLSPNRSRTQRGAQFFACNLVLPSAVSNNDPSKKEKSQFSMQTLGSEKAGCWHEAENPLPALGFDRTATFLDEGGALRRMGISVSSDGVPRTAMVHSINAVSFFISAFWKAKVLLECRRKSVPRAPGVSSP